MSNPQILPEEWIADSLENFLSHHHSKTNIIYIAVVITLIIFLLSLPFLYVDISVEGVGNIRPIKERSTLVSPVTEIVDHVYVREGDFIRKGDPLIKFEPKRLIQK